MDSECFAFVELRIPSKITHSSIKQLEKVALETSYTPWTEFPKRLESNSHTERGSCIRKTIQGYHACMCFVKDVYRRDIINMHCDGDKWSSKLETPVAMAKPASISSLRHHQQEPLSATAREEETEVSPSYRIHLGCNSQVDVKWQQGRTLAAGASIEQVKSSSLYRTRASYMMKLTIRSFLF